MFWPNETSLSEILLRGFSKLYFENPLRRISLKDVWFGQNIFCYTALGSRFFFETRVNFGWLYVGLKDSLPPLAIHILKALDVPFHMVPPNICHTY